MKTTKRDLVADVSRRTGLTQADTGIVVEDLIETISQLLVAGAKIKLRGFGTFCAKIRKPKPARNPRTGEVVLLKTRVVPIFEYSGELKQRIAKSLKTGTIAKPESCEYIKGDGPQIPKQHISLQPVTCKSSLS